MSLKSFANFAGSFQWEKSAKVPNLVANPENYFRRLLHPRDKVLAALEEEAERENIPSVGPVVGELLYFLARVTRATTILPFHAPEHDGRCLAAHL